MKKAYRSIIPMLFLFLLGCGNNTQTKEYADISTETVTKPSFFTIELKEKTKDKAIVSKYVIDKPVYQVTITFADAIKNVEYPLSEIADKVEYIKLETTPECFLADPVILAVTQEDIIINSTLKSKPQLYRFSRDGSFLNKIGEEGRGPGEYLDAYFCAVDEKNKYVYVNSRCKVSKFRFDGEFIDAYKTTESAEFIFVVNDSLIACQYAVMMGDEPYSLVVCKFNGDTVYTKRNNIRFKRPPTITGVHGNFDKPFFRYGEDVFFREKYGDTIFSLLPDSIIPRFKIEFGPYQLPPELLIEKIGSKRYYDISIGFLDYRIDEDDNYMYIGVQSHHPSDKQIMPIFYNKNDGELCHLIGHDVSSQRKKGFVNDIDGTFSFWPDYVSPNGEMFAIINVLRVAQMQEYLKDKTVKGTKPNPELYKIIEEFKLNDNPIISIIPKSKKNSK
jgi:hypothetical protein